MDPRVAPALVHIFTASGVVCGFLALLAAIGRDWQAMFLWLGAAFIIDGIDGTFARMFDVKSRLPRFNGERLDLVIDYVTYVLVPAYALYNAGFLAGTPGVALAAAILMSSLYHFCDEHNKSEDNCFVGFPAIWNIVAFYIFAFDAPPALAAMIVVACVLSTFQPYRWVHPMRVEAFQTLTLVLTLVWSVTAAAVVIAGFPAGWLAKAILAGVLLYGVGLSLFWRRPPEWRGDERP
jgi:phosphatidylcholine synthase